MTDRLSYDVVVVGGGPAGMTTALYTTRLGHRTAVFEKRGGRHAAVSHVHNLYGVSEDVSGRQLAKHAVDQFQEYGGDYYLDGVTEVRRVDDGQADGDQADGDGDQADHEDGQEDSEDGESDEGGNGRFLVDAEHATVAGDRVVFATGFTDVAPSVPDLERFTGRGLHYCLHCDAYTLGDERAFVLGHDDHAATVAMILCNFTADVDLLCDGRDPTWSDETERRLRVHPVDRVDAEVTGAYERDDADETWLGGLEFDDGTERAYLGGFAMYGTEYNTDLATDLGCALADDGTIDVDDRHETSVDGAYAVGDVTHGHNQTAIAIGDGARAGMAIHKDIRRYPRSADELAAETLDAPAASADLRSRMRLVRERESHAGLRGPAPQR